MKREMSKKSLQLNKTIGTHLKEIRKEEKLTQNEVAKAIGLEQSALSRVECGKQPLTAAQWVLFCQHMKITECCLVEWVS